MSSPMRLAVPLLLAACHRDDAPTSPADSDVAPGSGARLCGRALTIAEPPAPTTGLRVEPPRARPTAVVPRADGTRWSRERAGLTLRDAQGELLRVVSSATWAWDVAVQDDLAVLGLANVAGAQVRLLRLGTDGTDRLVTWTSDAPLRVLAVDDDELLAWDDGTLIRVDVSDPAAPVERGCVALDEATWPRSARRLGDVVLLDFGYREGFATVRLVDGARIDGRGEGRTLAVVDDRRLLVREDGDALVRLEVGDDGQLAETARVQAIADPPSTHAEGWVVWEDGYDAEAHRAQLVALDLRAAHPELVRWTPPADAGCAVQVAPPDAEPFLVAPDWFPERRFPVDAPPTICARTEDPGGAVTGWDRSPDGVDAVGFRAKVFVGDGEAWTGAWFDRDLGPSVRWLGTTELLLVGASPPEAPAWEVVDATGARLRGGVLDGDVVAVRGNGATACVVHDGKVDQRADPRDARVTCFRAGQDPVAIPVPSGGSVAAALPWGDGVLVVDTGAKALHVLAADGTPVRRVDGLDLQGAELAPDGVIALVTDAADRRRHLVRVDPDTGATVDLVGGVSASRLLGVGPDGVIHTAEAGSEGWTVSAWSPLGASLGTWTRLPALRDGADLRPGEPGVWPTEEGAWRLGVP